MRLISLILAVALGATALEAAQTNAGAAQSQGHPPNVLLITIDTLRADHLSSYGYAKRTSPYIDQLAKEGARFARAYTVIPLTGPSHLAIMCSRYPQEDGVRRNGEAIDSGLHIVALPQVLRSHGYQTGAFISAWPLLGRLTHLNDYFDTYNESLNRTYQLFNSSRWAQDVTPPALEWMRGAVKKNKPFFLWIHYFDPHSPYIYRDAYNPPNVDPAHPFKPTGDNDFRERVKDYDSEIYYCDHYIGKLFQALDQLGIEKSTMVVLTADHGESLGQHGYVGHGRHLYEGIIHVPLIIRYPGHVKAGEVVDTPVQSIDIMPTVLHLALPQVMSKKGAAFHFSGRNLTPALTSADPLTNRWVHYVTFAGKKGYAPKWMSWIWVHKEELPLRIGRTDGNSKMVWDPGAQKLYLYNLQTDPHELHAQVLDKGNKTYKADTSRLKKWFMRTETRAQTRKLSKHDIEVLKSLGYVQ